MGKKIILYGKLGHHDLGLWVRKNDLFIFVANINVRI